MFPMLTIRLMRFGRRNRPFFRLVVVPKRSKPKSGKYIEMVGWLDPLKHQSNVERERAKYWMSQGAKPSPTAWNLMVASGVVEGAKIPKHKKIQSQEPRVRSGQAIEKTQKATAVVSETKEVQMETLEVEEKKAVHAQKAEASAEA